MSLREDSSTALTLCSLDPPIGETIVISPVESTVIGRDPSSDVVIDHDSVSKSHATIRCVSGIWSISDNTSTNGTAVNSIGLDVDESIPLHQDDQLTIGSKRYMICGGGKPPSQWAPDLKEGGSDDRGTWATRASLLQQLAAAETVNRDGAWSRFHTVYAPLIRGFARRAGAQTHMLDDLVQEVTVAFFKAIGQFEYDQTRGRFRGYLKTCTINAMRRRWRKEREEVGMNTVVAFLADEATVETAWTDQWSAGMIEQAITTARQTSNMEPRTWEAFELYGRRGVPAEEVGRRLEMSAETVRRCKSRGAEAVRAALLELKSIE